MDDPNENLLPKLSNELTARSSNSNPDVAFVQHLPFALSYVASLEVKDRAVLFYDNLVVAAEYFCAYIEEGIKRRQVTCLTGLESAKYRGLFAQLGINVAELENAGYLRNLTDEDFLREAKWAKEIWCRKNRDVVARGRSKWEWEGVRFIHLHEFDPKQHDSLDNLMLAEVRLHALYGFPATAICCYDAKIIMEEPSDFFNGLLRAHDHCLFQGIAMPTSRILTAQTATIAPKTV